MWSQRQLVLWALQPSYDEVHHLPLRLSLVVTAVLSSPRALLRLSPQCSMLGSVAQWKVFGSLEIHLSWMNQCFFWRKAHETWEIHILVLIIKVLLEHSYSYYLYIAYGCFYKTTTQLRSVTGYIITIWLTCLSFGPWRKCLPNSALNQIKGKLIIINITWECHDACIEYNLRTHKTRADKSHPMQGLSYKQWH